MNTATVNRRKSKGYPSDKIYTLVFIFFEGFFILGVMPFSAFCILYYPVTLYFAITGVSSQIWPMYLFGFLAAFFEISALFYFVKRYFLKPKNMTFLEWVIDIFNHKKRKQEKEEKIQAAKKLNEFYEDLMIKKQKWDQLQKEQSNKIWCIYCSNFNLPTTNLEPLE